MESVAANGGEYGPSFGDDITAAYNDDMVGPNSKIELLEAKVAELTQKNLELGAANYDLITAQQVTPEEGAPEGDNDTDNDTDDNDVDVPTDEFFEEEE